MSYLRADRFEVIAHRGGSLEAPENTLPAFEHAFKLYDEIIFELDVHKTSDGRVVVFHDNVLERVTDGHGSVAGKTWDELQKLDAAYFFSQDGGKTFPWRGRGVRLPLLDEVMKRFPQTRVSIEFKGSSGIPFAEPVLEIIDRMKAQDRVVLAGENHVMLSAARNLAPKLCSGFSRKEIFWTVVWNKLHLPWLAPGRSDVLQVPFAFNGKPVTTPDLVRNAHRRGKQVHVWTVNDEATMRQLIEMDVDGIITDAPSLLWRVARELKKI